MMGGTISNNVSKYGGGLHFSSSDIATNVTIMGGSIVDNEATVQGGGISVCNESNSVSNTVVYLKKLTLENNISPKGENTYVWNGGQIIDQR